MCGFLGQISLNEINLKKLSQANIHQICRGPDETKFLNKNFCLNNGKNFYFSMFFNRLSIIDLSSLASQPMFSSHFNTLVLFNGEIYNHEQLRSELETKDIKFYSNHSDTEVVLNGFSYYGLEFVNKLIGQFSIVFVDFNKNTISLVRDRLGQKPLYYSTSNDELIFSSSFKSIVKMKNNFKIDEIQLNNYINFGVIPSPNTLFKEIKKVKPAEIIEINLNKSFAINKSYIYWNISNYFSENKFNEELFIEIFQKSIKSRLVADVPVATFLSGGIDSTSIVKEMTKNNTKVNTFSIIHENKKYNEEFWIDEVIKKYDTNHIYTKITASEVENEILNAIEALDEPFSDPSVVPMYILSKKISQYYKVALSGDGGDELLGGYTRFQKAIKNKNQLANLMSKLFHIYPGIFGSGSNLLSLSKSIDISYFSTLQDIKLLNLLNLKPKNNLSEQYFKSSNNIMKSIMTSEYNFFLSEMMLFKVDTTSMSNSLEVRSPFLDHRLIEYVFSCNIDILKNGGGKVFLRNNLKSEFSQEFINRKKMGFTFDIQSWIFSNLNFIKSEIKIGNIINNIDKNIIDKLSIYKSNINSHRIWKLFVTESFIKNLKN